MNKLAFLFITSILFISTTVYHYTENDSDKYCAQMRDGKTIVIHDGNLISAEVKLTNGAIVKPNGNVIMPDGTLIVLKNAECIDKDGIIIGPNDHKNNP